jgi:hypothetical protein
MFITDKLIYIQMQKTGCTHIASLLNRIFDGEQVGKHNAASKKQIHSDIFFITSTRNPWDWYLSLWTYGVQGSGDLMTRLAYRDYLMAFKQTLKDPWNNCSALFYEAKKDLFQWRSVYDESQNVESFRKWLKLILSPQNAPWMGEGYGGSAVTEYCGFMTYRYLYLCCSERKRLNNQRLISSYMDLVQFEQSFCYVDFFIRQESLEADFCSAMEKIKPLTDEEKNLVFSAGRTNTSKRPLVTSDYYDNETIELIRSRDRLLIEKFGYEAPT